MDVVATSGHVFPQFDLGIVLETSDKGAEPIPSATLVQAECESATVLARLQFMRAQVDRNVFAAQKDSVLIMPLSPILEMLVEA
jgi:hypothetical protein